MAEPETPKRSLVAVARDDLKLHSMKLAAAAAVAIGVLAGNTDILLALISIVPEEPLPRLVFAGALAALSYFGPRIARKWPQPELHEDAE